MSSLKPKKPETFAPVFETSDTLWYGLANIALKIKMNKYRVPCLADSMHTISINNVNHDRWRQEKKVSLFLTFTT